MSSATPQLSITLLDKETQEELDRCDTNDGGECWIGEPDRAFEILVDVKGGPPTWALKCYIDGVQLPYVKCGSVPERSCAFDCWVAADGKEARALVFSSSRLVKKEGGKRSSSRTASSFGEIRVKLCPTHVSNSRSLTPHRRTRTASPPLPSSEDEEERPSLSSEQLLARDGVKFFQQPGLCATLGPGVTTTDSFLNPCRYDYALPAVCSCTVRYDFADHLFLRKELPEELWSKYGLEEAEEEGGEGEDTAEVSARRMRLLKAMVPPGYSLVRNNNAPSARAGPRPVVDLTREGEGDDEEEEEEVEEEEVQQPGLRRSKRLRVKAEVTGD